MLDGPVAMHEDEVLALASEILGAAERPREYDGKYLDCPGCGLLVHHSDASDHPQRCRALRDHAIYCADAHPRDPQPARLPGGAH